MRLGVLDPDLHAVVAVDLPVEVGLADHSRFLGGIQGAGVAVEVGHHAECPDVAGVTDRAAIPVLRLVLGDVEAVIDGDPRRRVLQSVVADQLIGHLELVETVLILEISELPTKERVPGAELRFGGQL